MEVEGEKNVVEVFVKQMAKSFGECFDLVIQKCLEEQNLYKMDPWKEPNKKCRHNNSVFCDKCRIEIENERNNLT
jgi:hypothetical protein